MVMNNAPETTAQDIIEAVAARNWNGARAALRQMSAGRVGYEEADKHNGGTAGVLVDGVRVGQAANLLIGFTYAAEMAVRANRR